MSNAKSFVQVFLVISFSFSFLALCLDGFAEVIWPIFYHSLPRTCVSNTKPVNMACHVLSCHMRFRDNCNDGFKQACGILLFSHYIFTTTIPIPTELNRMVTNHKGLSPIKPSDILISGHVRPSDKNKHYIATAKKLIITKHGMVMAYNDEFALIKTHDTSIM